MSGIDAFNVKVGTSICGPITQNTTSNGTAVGTSGYSFARGVFRVGSTAGNLSVIKVQESDDGSTWSDVPGLSFDALGATDDNKDVVANIDLRGRKRDLRWVATEDNTGAVAGAYGIFVLGGAAESPFDATTIGAEQVLTA